MKKHRRTHLLFKLFVVFLLLLPMLGQLSVTDVKASCTPGNQVNVTAFFSAVLQEMNIPVTQFALDAFSAWLPYENTVACWNPLATTYHVAWMPAGTGCTETIFNSVGVRNYSSAYCGELATARTLLYAGGGNYYLPIREMLKLNTFNWQSIHDSIKLWVGSEAYATSITNKWQNLWNNRSAELSAQFNAQSVPLTMQAGKSYQVSVTFKNTGTVSWTRASNFKLGSQNPRDNYTWGVQRVYLSSGDTIANGQSKVFAFTVTAPSTPGTYNFQWQMLREGVSWFGSTSTNLAVKVTSADSIIVNPPALNPGYSGGMCGNAWYRFTGYGGQYAYLTLNTNQSSQSTNSAIWQPNLPVAGSYKVEAYIANHPVINWQCPTKTISGDTSDARYTIYHANGNTIVSKDQLPLSNAWLNLGNYTFNAGTAGKVKLTDLNGEANLSRTVSFSAIRFTRIDPLNTAPTNVSLSNNNVAEGVPVGTTVGTFSTTDPDAGDSHTYSFCGGSNDASFSINGNTLKTAAVFDYEIKSSYSVCIRSTDSGNLSFNKTFTINITNVSPGQSFSDVPTTYWAWQYIEALAQSGITGGCGNNTYCPESLVTRAQMAVFLEKGLHYPSTFTPPNVSPTFIDTSGHWAEDWIEALKSDGITSGCTANAYCPESSVTRAQMAIFLLKARYGSGYTPSTNVPITFSDTNSHWARYWIEQLAKEGVTSGCGVGVYCPETPVTRAQMAVFLAKTFWLPIP